MNIQSSINQGISLATLLATQSPGLKAMGEQKAALAKIDKQEAILNRKKSVIAKQESTPTVKNFSENMITNSKDDNDIMREDIALKKQRFDIDPSEASYRAYTESVKRQQADISARQKQEQAIETRRRILEGTPSEYLMRGGK